MAFGENLKRAFTNSARAVVKKSGEAIEIAKNKYNQFDLNGELESLYAKLGRFVYNSYTSGDTDINDDIENLCAKIRTKEAELELLKNK